MNIEQERITKLTREILVGVQKLTLGDFKDASLVSEQITKLSLYRAHTSEDIKDKLLIVANSNWLDCEDALIDYIEAWAYQDFDFIDRNTLVLMSALQAEGETFGDTDWLLLLNSVDADIKRFLSKISRV
ncbi:hypothetical protein [Methylobacter sp. S3L5C]|uniref:hypothetical protein n=1 Tax=Methylobacter sp. S3L5C TaxID=2839024 RepID=UPI001FAC76AD|nr:hypothetical protein [Methylobacter sp. S3L5C]UOA06940.1 hypothetical protein KKZ03_11380 [Methylobacter sp. S3L5C]